jgi:TolA-binding protein
MNQRASCPRFVEIGRSASPEDVPALRLHLDECVYCQSQWAATKRLIEAARQLPIKAPEAGRRQRARNALLIAATDFNRRRVSPRWLQAAVYAAVILCAAGVLAAVGTVAIPWLQKQRGAAPAAADRDRGRLHAKASLQPPAKTETIPAPECGPSSATAAPPSEPVAVVSAEPQAPQTPIMGKAAGRQASTRRLRGALASVSHAVPSPKSTHLPSPAELAFSEGCQALRSADYPRAATAMRRALEAGPTSAVAEDARYWEAVALARQGSVAKARLAMEEFVRLLPGSPRAGEVSAMLGWLLLESREWSAAEQRFRAAENDRAPAVRESARKGLEIAARMRSRPKTAP